MKKPQRKYLDERLTYGTAQKDSECRQRLIAVAIRSLFSLFRITNMADKQYLIEAAKAVHATLPDHHGFILMAIPHEGGDGRLKYISSLKREDAINVLKEWLINCGHEEDWMKHL